jgi:hypothetical protein
LISESNTKIKELNQELKKQANVEKKAKEND